MALDCVGLLSFRYKKRRLGKSFFVDLVGRDNLNLFCKLLICNINNYFNI